MAKKPATSKSKPAKRIASAAKKSTAKGRKTTARGTASKPKTTKNKSSKAGDQEVTIDRRRKPDRRIEEPSKKSAPNLERREKVQRRRQIDPTTCERDYTSQEVDFMNAMDEYKRKSGRMFPTCSEVLEVIRGLGYVQLTPAELAARQGSESQAEVAEVAEVDEQLTQEEELEAVTVSEVDSF